MFSQKIQNIIPSATFAMKQKAEELAEKGLDIIQLTIGEPDFDSPVHVKKAAIEAIKNGFNKYTATSGTNELKKAIIDKFKRDNNIEYNTDQVMATAGGKQALYNIFQTILCEGDEVILSEPYWVSYVEQILLSDAKPVVINTIPNNFKLTADMVKKAITPRTKALVICSPSNPTGTIIDEGEIIKIAKLAVENNFYVISDEVYEFFYFTNKKPISIGSLGKDIFDLTLTVNAVSKSFSMTGWRLGFVGGNSQIIKLMDGLQGHVTSNPNIIAQKAAIAALNGSLDCVYEMKSAFNERKNYLEAFLLNIPNINFAPMDGAFYAFIDVSKYYKNGISTSDEFCLKMLSEVGLGVTPGSAFGKSCDNYIRMSYAANIDQIKEGGLRLKKFLEMI